MPTALSTSARSARALEIDDLGASERQALEVGLELDGVVGGDD